MKAKFATVLCLVVSAICAFAASPVDGLLERIDRGASKKFIVRIADAPDGKDYFEIADAAPRIKITGNNPVSVATGLNWYLRHYAGVHLTWNNMTAQLPDRLPQVGATVRKSTDMALRYDFNYCTYSYTMPFWDWERWEQEIDWMALHGINMPLAAVGQECVWRGMLTKLGYSKDDVNRFVAGPAFLAWWAMNNLEGWGGPLPDSWYDRQEKLQKKILARMKDFGIKPVLPGYSGMMPSDADSTLGLNVVKSGLWNGFTRPSFLNPSDSAFARMATLYYDEQKRLFGTADFYSMDPFHESGPGVVFDFAEGGRAVMEAMKKANPDARWVVQGWEKNPREEMIDGLRRGDLIVLDLFAECRPMWGAPSAARRPDGFKGHHWLMCLLENFGGNIGLHGRIDMLLSFWKELESNPLAASCKGIGLTMEGSENNPVMFELMTELPWLDTVPDKHEWIKEYHTARYGAYDSRVDEAWRILSDGIYNAPPSNRQQGTHESIFCARPSADSFQASTWSKMANYYDPATTARAAALMLEAAENFRGNNNFEYDLVDIVRQAVADEGRRVYQHAMAGYKAFARKDFEDNAAKFLRIIELQDSLLATRAEFRVGSWLEKARAAGVDRAEKDLYEWNARVQITTWGLRECADKGRLHDYAHKEWNGILRDFYLPRWQRFFSSVSSEMDGQPAEAIDFYAMEEPWTLRTCEYTSEPEGDCIDVARNVFRTVFNR